MGTLFSGIFDSELVSVISFSDFMLCMMCALVVGLILAGMYMYKNQYTKSFVATLALLPAIVCAVIMMVNGNRGCSRWCFQPGPFSFRTRQCQGNRCPLSCHGFRHDCRYGISGLCGIICSAPWRHEPDL